MFLYFSIISSINFWRVFFVVLLTSLKFHEMNILHHHDVANFYLRRVLSYLLILLRVRSTFNLFIIIKVVLHLLVFIDLVLWKVNLVVRLLMLNHLFFRVFCLITCVLLILSENMTVRRLNEYTLVVII
jgi:hypothetical protein